MWKGRPVVASLSAASRTRSRTEPRGWLVDPTDLAAFGARVSEMLADPHAAERIGEAAKTRVRDEYLGPRHLGQYVDLLGRILAPSTTA